MFDIFIVLNMINPNYIYWTKLHFVLTIWATNYNILYLGLVSQYQVSTKVDAGVQGFCVSEKFKDKTGG